MAHIQTMPNPEDPTRVWPETMVLFDEIALVADGSHDALGVSPEQQAAEVAQLNELLYDNSRVIAVAERLEDQASRERAERIFTRVGRMALGKTIEVNQVTENPMTLKEAIDRAADGDTEAHQMVKTNVRTEAVERLYKAAHVTEAMLEVDEQGRTIQFGQTAEDFNTNSLLHASDDELIKPRSHAETRNSMRIEDARREGLLKDHYFVVISLCPRDVSDEKLDQLNFFSKTYSMTIQATTEIDKAKLGLESAFIAGIAQKDGQHERHDQQAVALFGKKLGLDLEGKSEAELIDFPAFISKEMMPDGVIDLSKLMDECIEEVIGESVFYGEAKPKQDYKEHRELCRQREQALEARVDSATATLLAQRSQNKTPIQAARRLNKVVQAEMLQTATKDHSIDEQVFGKAGAQELQVARAHWLNGDVIGMQTALFRANKVATGGSCPMALRQEAESSDQDGPDGESQQNAKSEESCKEIKNGERVNCPFCKKKVNVIVEGDNLYCNNSECTAAHSSVKKK